MVLALTLAVLMMISGWAAPVQVRAEATEEAAVPAAVEDAVETTAQDESAAEDVSAFADDEELPESSSEEADAAEALPETEPEEADGAEDADEATQEEAPAQDDSREEAVEEAEPTEATEDAEDEEEADFAATVTIRQKPDVLYFGEQVRLVADVQDANMAYSLYWEYSLPLPEDADPQQERQWIVLQADQVLELDITLENSVNSYRVRLVAENGQTILSAEYQMTDIQEKPVEETAEEATEEMTEEMTGEVNEEEAGEETEAEENPAQDPADAAEESLEIDDYDTPLGLDEATEAEETSAPPMSVTIFSSRRDVAVEGDTITLTSRVEGFDGYEITYQWECDQGDGFQPVEGANDDSYSFTMSANSLRWNWRLTIYYR